MSDSEHPEQLEILIKPSRGDKKTVCVSSKATVAELKDKLSELYDIPASNQRLIYSGRILKDDQSLEVYSIKSGHSLHLVKGGSKSGAQPTSTSVQEPQSRAQEGPGATHGVPTNIASGAGTGNILSDLTGARYAGFANLPSASMFGPDGGMGPAPDIDQVLSMMERPGFSEAMQMLLSDPDTMSQMNPMLDSMPPAQAQQFREFLRTPEFRQLMSDPQALRQMFQQAQMLRNLFGNSGESGGSFGGFPAPGPTEPNDSNANSSGSGQNPLLSFLGNSAGNSSNQFPDLSALLGSGLAGSGAAAAVQEDSRPPEERYEHQLAQLNELGFYDFDRNVRALRRSGGNVEGAIDALLDGGF